MRLTETDKGGIGVKSCASYSEVLPTGLFPEFFAHRGDRSVVYRNSLPVAVEFGCLLCLR